MSDSERYNLLRQNAFVFNIQRLPETMFRVTNVQLPAITVPAPNAGYPGVTQYFPGTFTEFEELIITFLVDENLKNYEEIFNWITQQRFCTTVGTKPTTNEMLLSDGTLSTLTNASVANRVFFFRDMFPVSISGIQFDSSVSSPEPIECSVSFKFSYFEIK